MGVVFDSRKGTWVLLSFIAFFSVIVAVNTVFITFALETHSGVVVKQPYKKGLAYDEILEKAKAQSGIAHDISYQDGILRLSLPVMYAEVTARFVRIVKQGYDFDVTLAHQGDGIYSAKQNMPLPGAWTAKLKATWDDQTFQATHDFIAP